MRILLINPKIKGYTRSITAPLGLLSIASSLQAEGHKVEIYDRTVEKEKAETVFESFAPDIVGISLVSIKSISDMKSIAASCKTYGLFTVVGGPLASELPADVLDCGNVDAVSIGEGERTWSEIAALRQKGESDLSLVKGIAYKAGDEIILTPQREFIDLGELPPLDWSLIDVEKYFQRSYGCNRMLYLYSAKGCPNDCTFCYNKDFHRCTYRKRPIEHVTAEIRYLVENHGLDGVYFADELWCRNRAEMKETCDALKALDLPFVWGCQTRVGFFTREDFDYMYDCGCRWVFFGIESGSKAVLERMHKHIPYDKIIPTVNSCSESGIATIVSFIVGFPDETVDDLKETVRLIEQLRTPLVNLNYYIIVPGSDMYKELIEKGRYIKPTFEQIEREDQLEIIEHNFSFIPENDMRFVRAHYMWRSFTAGNVTKDKSGSSFTLKVIIDALKGLTGNGFVAFVASAVYSAATFIRIFVNSHAHPGIKKKYGIK